MAKGANTKYQDPSRAYKAKHHDGMIAPFRTGNPGRPPGIKNGEGKNAHKNPRYRLLDPSKMMELHGFNPMQARLEYIRYLRQEIAKYRKRITDGVWVGRWGREHIMTDYQIENTETMIRVLQGRQDRVTSELMEYVFPKKKHIQADLDFRSWLDIITNPDGEKDKAIDQELDIKPLVELEDGTFVDAVVRMSKEAGGVGGAGEASSSPGASTPPQRRRVRVQTKR